jgi:signal transduction histidine kinase/ActR/RegA family two-component response regulator
VQLFRGFFGLLKADRNSSVFRTSGGDNLARNPADEVIGAVRIEQVAATFRQVPIAVVVNIVNTGITAIVLAAISSTKLPFLWFGAATLVSIGGWLLWRRYQRATLQVENVRAWGIRLAAGSLLGGLSWGVGGAVLLPAIPGFGQTFFVSVLGGMCAGGVVLSVPHLPTLLAFLLSASLPVAFRLFATGLMADTALAAMIIVFAVALALAGTHLNRFFTAGLRLRSELNEANIRLRAEIAEHRKTEASLHQAQKLEAVGQLTGGIAHDFNNLLTIACGSLELLEARISDERSLRLLRSAQGAMSRGAKLTESLLAFARKQRLEPVVADLNCVVAEMTDLLRRSIGPTVEVRHSLAAALWPTLIDTNQIATAILNIAINARDAMPRGGVLVIETANIRAGDDDLPEEVVDKDCVLLSMTDTGTGMSPEVIEHAFEPFFTTKEVGKGTGLGLSTVFGLVHQSGGAIRIRSRVGEGTTAEIYLPRAKGASMARTEDASRARTSSGARILVVDDDPDVRWLTVEYLREMGHFVAEADSGRAALAILERGDPCDLIVMDQVMPGLLGTETVRLVKQTRPELKVLFVTGYADKFEGSGDALIMKPFTLATLTEAVRNALRQKHRSESGNVTPFRRARTP